MPRAHQGHTHHSHVHLTATGSCLVASLVSAVTCHVHSKLKNSSSNTFEGASIIHGMLLVITVFGSGPTIIDDLYLSIF